MSATHAIRVSLLWTSQNTPYEYHGEELWETNIYILFIWKQYAILAIYKELIVFIYVLLYSHWHIFSFQTSFWNCHLHKSRLFKIHDPTFHDLMIHDSYINYILLYMPCTDWREGKQLTLLWKLYRIIWIGLKSIVLKQKADKVTRNFFPAVHISFLCQSHLVYLEN